MYRWIALIIRLALILVGLSPFSARAAESRVALVIGNAAYAHAPSLPNPSNDARAMEQALSGYGFQVTRLENASKSQIESAVAKFEQQLTPNTVSLLYYAGHGVQLQGHNYLIPVDARIEDEAAIRLAAVDLGALLQRIASAHSKATFIILDACRNNPFDQSVTVTAMADEIGRSLKATDTGRFRNVAAGLAPVDAPSGVLIAYATAPGKVAADGEGTNGLYTGELIRAMASNVSIEEVFKLVRRAVIEKSSGKQIPWESSSLTISFTFRVIVQNQDRGTASFDGIWRVAMDCQAVGGTRGYTMSMPAQVSAGVFHGEVGVQNQPGWAKFEGRISADGSADIIGTGLTGGDIGSTLGQLQPGLPASYHYVAQFDGSKATGKRVDSRPCSFDAIKMP
jgi:hypothetical protein